MVLDILGYTIYQKACTHRELLENDDYWHNVLTEASFLVGGIHCFINGAQFVKACGTSNSVKKSLVVAIGVV